MKYLMFIALTGCTAILGDFNVAIPPAAGDDASPEASDPPEAGSDGRFEFSPDAEEDSSTEAEATPEAASDAEIDVQDAASQDVTYADAPLYCSSDSKYANECPAATIDCQQPDLSCPVGYCCDISCLDPDAGASTTYRCLPQ